MLYPPPCQCDVPSARYIYSSRRLFLAAAASAAVWPRVAFGAASVPEALRHVGFRYVVVDRRYPESRAFAAALAANGGIRLDVADGLTSLWQNALVPLWRTPGNGPIAGLTSPAVLACLAEQARSEGRRAFAVQPHAPQRPAGRSGHSSLVSWAIA